MVNPEMVNPAYYLSHDDYNAHCELYGIVVDVTSP